MKYSTRLSDAVHMLLFIHLNPTNDLTSNALANSIQTNPAFVRQIMSALKKSGIIESFQGRATPTLSRSPKQISLLEVYKAVEGDKPLLHLDTHTNPECGVGINIQNSIQDFYNQIQETVENEMSKISLCDIIENYKKKL